MKNIYEFETEVKGGRGNIQWWWCSKSKIEINNGKLIIDNTINESKDMLYSVKDCSGTYNVGEIKSIKISSKQLWETKNILLTVVFLIFIIYFIIESILNEYCSGLEIFISMWLLVIISLRVKTIKITFKSNQRIHIPIKPLLGRYKSIDYSEEINEFLNIIKDNIQV